MDKPIFPFLWMRGEEEAILRREIEKIAQCGIGAVCVEARPHDDFCGPGGRSACFRPGCKRAHAQTRQ